MKMFKLKFPRLKSPRSRLKKRSTNLMIPVLVIILAGLMLTMAVSFYIANREIRYNTEYSSYVAEQKLLSQRIATSSQEAARGKREGFVVMQGDRDRFQETLNYLKSGNPATALPPMSGDSLRDALAGLDQAWDLEYRLNIDAIIDNREVVSSITENIQQVNSVLPKLKKLSADVARILAERKADPQTIFIATQQPLFIEQVESNLNLILAGGGDAETASDQFGRDFQNFSRFVNALTKGDTISRIERVRSAEGQNKLAEQKQLYRSVQNNITGILNESANFLDVLSSATLIQEMSPEMLQAGEQLETEIEKLGKANEQLTMAGYGAAVLFVILAVILTMILITSSRKRELETSEINRRNQEAILRLLDEMTHLAEGDLTTHTTVTEDITGAIADSVNFSIDALRSLVETINDTVAQVSSSSEQTQAITNRLAAASNQQAQEITTTTNAISNMATTMDKVSKSAMTSADVALRSVEIAGKGADTVRRNIEAMDLIRETIQETSKRIKRLGESSQQIGEIVALITDIADRTNILALNAAIQASSAGEAGRGFAVVADEVQRLAERAGNATKQISALVETIQTDTNEAVSSMEDSTAGVVKGAQLAEDAGGALAEIEKVSKELADLIQGISQEAREQASAATNISESMNVIQRITVETSEGTKETAVSVGNLTELANELRNSVAGFKLPDSTEIRAAANG